MEGDALARTPSTPPAKSNQVFPSFPPPLPAPPCPVRSKLFGCVRGPSLEVLSLNHLIAPERQPHLFPGLGGHHPVPDSLA